jgi:hypothetical protein
MATKGSFGPKKGKELTQAGYNKRIAEINRIKYDNMFKLMIASALFVPTLGTKGKELTKGELQSARARLRLAHGATMYKLSGSMSYKEYYNTVAKLNEEYNTRLQQITVKYDNDGEG